MKVRDRGESEQQKVGAKRNRKKLRGLSPNEKRVKATKK